MDTVESSVLASLCSLVFFFIYFFLLAAAVFLNLTSAKEAVAWPLSGKQSRNFREEELSNKWPGAIHF